MQMEPNDRTNYAPLRVKKKPNIGEGLEGLGDD